MTEIFTGKVSLNVAPDHVELDELGHRVFDGAILSPQSPFQKIVDSRSLRTLEPAGSYSHLFDF